MSSHLKTILFAAALCVICSLTLTAASTGLKSFQERNVVLDRQKNILKAFTIISDQESTTAEQIESLYNQNVHSLWIDGDGRIKPLGEGQTNHLPIYVHLDKRQVQAYAVPVDTRGLWGEIHGYLAIEKDGVTIRGFTVYQHAETPGLGGEIESRWFRKNFKGKKIINQDGHFVSIRIAKGEVKDVIPGPQQPNFVDGISGATLTGRFLSTGLKQVLKTYEPVAIQFRHKNPRYLRVN